MSRIGKLPIALPKGVTCSFAESDHVVSIKGPKGELKQKLDPDFKVIRRRNCCSTAPY
jgi:large subunit ribosomal protein L6